MDLQSSLDADNVRILDLVQLLEDTSVRQPDRREELVYELRAEVEAHNRAEERVLYPLLLADKPAHDAVIRARQENHANEVLLEELHQMPKTDSNFDHKVRVLASELSRHADFEKSEVHGRLPSFVSEAQLEDLVARMRQEKERARSDVHDRY